MDSNQDLMHVRRAGLQAEEENLRAGLRYNFGIKGDADQKRIAEIEAEKDGIQRELDKYQMEAHIRQTGKASTCLLC